MSGPYEQSLKKSTGLRCPVVMRTSLVREKYLIAFKAQVAAPDTYELDREFTFLGVRREKGRLQRSAAFTTSLRVPEVSPVGHQPLP